MAFKLLSVQWSSSWSPFANRGKNKGFSCEKERVCAALFYLSRIRFGTADGRGKNLDRRRSVRLTLFCTTTRKPNIAPLLKKTNPSRPTRGGLVSYMRVLRAAEEPVAEIEPVLYEKNHPGPRLRAQITVLQAHPADLDQSLTPSLRSMTRGEDRHPISVVIAGVCP